MTTLVHERVIEDEQRPAASAFCSDNDCLFQARGREPTKVRKRAIQHTRETGHATRLWVSRYTYYERVEPAPARHT